MEHQLAGLLRLVREKRLEEACDGLQQIIQAAPDVAAQWLVLARLCFLDPARWEQVLQSALGQLGGAPLAAYRQAVKVLASQIPDPVTPMGPDPVAVAPDVLSSQESTPVTPMEPEPTLPFDMIELEALWIGLEHYRRQVEGGEVVRLESWLDTVRASRAEQMLSARFHGASRAEQRLGALAARMDASGRKEWLAVDRVVKRLDGLRQAVA
ncbi:MAG: hypothetical protein H7839_21500 [Magnetococcus sp. YQC-5]